uniref:Alpha-mannosidase n=1 Tax=Eptatretus burgeri TaxID=7764 RepID=A0A8C4NBV9_EPTBU
MSLAGDFSPAGDLSPAGNLSLAASTRPTTLHGTAGLTGLQAPNSELQTPDCRLNSELPTQLNSDLNPTQLVSRHFSPAFYRVRGWCLVFYLRPFTPAGSAPFVILIRSLCLCVGFLHAFICSVCLYPCQGQLSELQEKLSQLEHLLEENHQMMNRLRDSVRVLSGQESQVNQLATVTALKGPWPWRQENGSWMLHLDFRTLEAGPILAEADCHFASRMEHGNADIQMADMFNTLPFDNPDGGVWKQGFDIHYNNDDWNDQLLQIFVVPHSHNDPGWLKTFDAYYQDQTRHVLDGMTKKMAEDPRRAFVWAEVSFLAKWWNDTNKEKRQIIKSLIKSGQLEIVTGGWVMTDEANSHYTAMLDQLIEGHQWLHRNLAWAIDPFGHTSTMAYLLQGSGLHHMLIQRVHYAIKKQFSANISLEFLWRQNDEGKTDILCHMMPFYSYDIPHTCGPDPKICCQFDFKRLPGGRVSCPWRVPPQPITVDNVQSRAQLLLDQYRKKSKLFRTSVLLVPLGDDFRYDTPQEWDQQFGNYQRIFDYINTHPELRVQFGTLSQYFAAMTKAAGWSDGPGPRSGHFPVVSGDFFTYADRDDHYWSGFYTSRPFFKYLDRVLETRLRSAEVLFGLTLAHASHMGFIFELAKEDFSRLVQARQNLALFQHHDGLTGTGKDPVVNDYGSRYSFSAHVLEKAIVESILVFFASCSMLMECKICYILCFLFPKTSVQPSLLSPVVIFNPLALSRSCTVHVRVNHFNVHVTSADKQAVPAQIVPLWFDKTTVSTKEFEVGLAGVQAEGWASEMNLCIDFAWYGTRSSRDKSGAYLFLPDGEAKPYVIDKPPVIRVTEGPLFSEVKTLLPHVTHSVRVYNLPGVEGLSLEISNIVDIRQEQNRELVMRTTSDLDNKGIFFTDLNGFQMQRRKLWKKLPLQANFYPFPTMAFLQDSHTRLSLLSSQALGIGSLKNGKFLTRTKKRIVERVDEDGEYLYIPDTNHENKIRKTHKNTFLVLAEELIQPHVSEPYLAYPSPLGHITSDSLNHPPIVLISTMSNRASLSLRPSVHLLSQPLPCDIHLVNIRTLQSLVRYDVGLILHRKGIDCSLTPQQLHNNCSSTGGKVQEGSTKYIQVFRVIQECFVMVPLLAPVV